MSQMPCSLLCEEEEEEDAVNQSQGDRTGQSGEEIEDRKVQGQNRKCKRKRRKMGQREEKWAGRRKERK
jgi:hypothetical protein